ncbi:MAG: amino acid dehydrogenase [bacterium]|nr:amino acid dehydrogenase [bacterium]
MRELERLIEAWDGLAVVANFDKPTGSWIFICIHDNTLGPSTGGTRIATYASPADGLHDAMRLSEGMTQKWAAVDLGFGGAKAVLAVPHPMAGEERRGLLERYAKQINLLGGAFLTGEDMGISPEDMEFMARFTDHLHGYDDRGRKVDPSPYTARGVLTGIKAALERRFGEASVRGRKVVVQGAGNVGSHLIRMLADEGARVLIEDVDEERARSLAKEHGGELINGGDSYSTACDVFAPCAVGAILNRETIPKLECPIVAGSANNQLEEREDVERLRERGIMYAPDYIVNAGGAISFAYLGRGISEPAELIEKVDSIGTTLAEILKEAEERGESTLAAAERRVARTLERARG